MPDVLGVCDCVVVLRKGRKVSDKLIKDISPEKVTSLSTGGFKV
jgi:ABC-type sugar transport system ATPase subunit